jgi:hypothetical protein
MIETPAIRRVVEYLLLNGASEPLAIVEMDKGSPLHNWAVIRDTPKPTRRDIRLEIN